MPHLHRRAVTALALSGAFAVGGASSALADTAPGSGLTPTPAAHAPTTPMMSSGHGHAAFGGLFKALFDVFGAVRTQIPTVAAPVIAQGVSHGTITQAEADQLTALFTVTSAGSGSGAEHATPTTTTPSAGSGLPMSTTPPAHHAHPSFSAGQRTVLHQVAAAIVSQLATIAKPVLTADVTAGTITQAQEDLILKVLGTLSAVHLPTAAASTGNPAAGLQQVATARVAAMARHGHGHGAKRTHAHR